MNKCKTIEKKKIYLIFTYTGTILSRIIKYYTKIEYPHVSISLDIKMKKMYSFARINPYNPIMGGFVHEGIGFGTFKRFGMTTTTIYELEINEEQYNKIVETIRYMKIHKNLYHFNILGLVGAGFHKRFKFENSFYCAEFVKYLLDCSGVKTNLPDVIRPDDFRKLNDLHLIYQGRLNEYNNYTRQLQKM